MTDSVERIIGHPVRRRLIEALWHSSEPLSARRFHSEYTDGSDTLGTISYHLRVLERGGVARSAEADDAGQDAERPVVLAGPKCSAVLRRLKLPPDDARPVS